jgi:signal transduction histidine kinase
MGERRRRTGELPRHARRASWSPRGPRPLRFSVLTHLVALVLVLLAPLLAFSAFLVLRGGTDDVALVGPVGGPTWLLILAGGVALALALVPAAAIGHRIARALTGLRWDVEAAGRLEHVGPAATGILETDSVARSLSLAIEQLRQSAYERAMLLDRIITAQEAERKRIARELHDSLGQHLAAIGLGLSAIESQFAHDQTAHLRLAELRTLTSSMGRELHRTASELWPMALEDLGLQRAVIQYMEEWAERSSMIMDLETNLNGRRLPRSVETALFRVLQEAIGNVVHHSGADRVGVVLESGDRDVQLIVEDNGRGLGADWHELGGQHVGLLGLRERLALAGGSLEVESSEQGGTTVYARLPL